jgi:hypothetical protein
MQGGWISDFCHALVIASIAALYVVIVILVSALLILTANIPHASANTQFQALLHGGLGTPRTL